MDAQFGWLNNVVRAPPIPTSGIMDPIDPATVVSYTDDRAFANPGAYAEVELDAAQSLRVLAGVRFDHFGILGASTVSPRAMTRIELHPRAVARVGFGLYATPPRGYYIVPGFGNPDLDPDRSEANKVIDFVARLIEGSGPSTDGTG